MGLRSCIVVSDGYHMFRVKRILARERICGLWVAQGRRRDSGDRASGGCVSGRRSGMGFGRSGCRSRHAGSAVIGALNPALLNRQAELASEFAHAEPYRHLVIDDFLEAGLCESLMAEFPAFDRGTAINERGEVGRKSARPDVLSLGAPFRRVDGLMRDRAFLEFTSRITGIPELLYDAEYVGGGTHESLEGGDMDVHIDFNYHPHTRQHRR